MYKCIDMLIVIFNNSVYKAIKKHVDATNIKRFLCVQTYALYTHPKFF